jgi:hypothetical protein
MKTLVEKLFEANNQRNLVEDEIFENIQKILSGKPIEDLSFDKNEGAIDIIWDYYDNSVEIIRTDLSTPMTEEQANEILKIGFNFVYENCGEKCRLWNGNHFQECRPKLKDELDLKRSFLEARDGVEKFTIKPIDCYYSVNKFSLQVDPVEDTVIQINNNTN